MAREYIQVVKDDVTGKVIKEDDVHTLHFGWGGKSYTIDLGPQTAEEFMNVMSKYVDAATLEADVQGPPTERRRGRPAGASSADRGSKKEELAAIRAWWREQGNEISDRGRIPQTVVDAYAAAK